MILPEPFAPACRPSAPPRPAAARPPASGDADGRDFDAVLAEGEAPRTAAALEEAGEDARGLTAEQAPPVIEADAPAEAPPALPSPDPALIPPAPPLTIPGGAAPDDHPPEAASPSAPPASGLQAGTRSQAVAPPGALAGPGGEARAAVVPPQQAAPVPTDAVVPEAAPPAKAMAEAVADGAPAPRRAPTNPARLDLAAPAVDLRPADAPPIWQIVAEAPAGSARAEAAHHAQAAAAAPVAQQVVGQVVVAITAAAEPKLEIRLDPPELGRVEIRLTETESGVQAVVMAQRPETQDLLRRHAEQLAGELVAAGYGDVSLDFAGGEATSGGGERPGSDWIELGAAATSATPVAAAPSRAAASLTGLDIRL